MPASFDAGISKAYAVRPGLGLSLADSGLDQGLQLAVLEHLENDVAATNQLTIHPQLREGRPVGIGRQAGTNFRVLQDVDISELLATAHYRLGRASGKTALRGVGRTLHVKQHRVVGDLFFDGFDDIHGVPRLDTVAAHCNGKSMGKPSGGLGFVAAQRPPARRFSPPEAVGCGFAPMLAFWIRSRLSRFVAPRATPSRRSPFSVEKHWIALRQ
ncbi:hypothetical protein PXNS11_110088 [Stutzerimonas xanthomarina]|nr:hypothetical protein PXNS11_110088 [Stutzerimonas xanthomarina]